MESLEWKQRRRIALAQGAYFVATGLWPIFNMRSFQRVTGPKREDWLVKAMGAVIATVGATLIRGAFRRPPSRDLGVLANGVGLSLALIESRYAASRRLRRVYLLDAALEVGFAFAWAATNRGKASLAELRPSDGSAWSIPPVGAADID